MEQAKLDRINALAQKAKSEAGLTPQETQERDALRREYIDAYRRSLTVQLDNTYVQYPDGSRKKLKKKQEAPNGETAGPSGTPDNCAN